jgi:hypothetical protein
VQRLVDPHLPRGHVPAKPRHVAWPLHRECQRDPNPSADDTVAST